MKSTFKGKIIVVQVQRERKLLWTEGALCLQPKPMKVRKGKPAGGFMTELLSMFTCQVSIVSQIAIPVFSARLRHRKQTSKETVLCWYGDTYAQAHSQTHTHPQYTPTYMITHKYAALHNGCCVLWWWSYFKPFDLGKKMTKMVKTQSPKWHRNICLSKQQSKPLKK